MGVGRGIGGRDGLEFNEKCFFKRNNLNHGELGIICFVVLDNKISKFLDVVIGIVFFENNLNITMTTIQTPILLDNKHINLDA